MSRRRATDPGLSFAAEEDAAHPEPDREERASPIPMPSQQPPVTVPPLVAFSDGSQAVDGRAILAGLPLPDGYRLADFGPGFAQGPVAACTGCGRGTIIYQNGKPQHRGCPTEEDITRARR